MVYLDAHAEGEATGLICDFYHNGTFGPSPKYVDHRWFVWMPMDEEEATGLIFHLTHSGGPPSGPCCDVGHPSVPSGRECRGGSVWRVQIRTSKSPIPGISEFQGSRVLETSKFESQVL